MTFDTTSRGWGEKMRIMLENPVLVIGGGISGITAAVEIAEVGHKVIFVEKLPYLGGRVIRFHEYFPKLCPPYCGLEINFKRIRQNPRIQVLTSTTVNSIKGSKGKFTVKLTSQPACVNSNCTACGECVKVCPVERTDEFNYALCNTKAIYLPHELAFPYRYSIDDEVCLKEKCAKCTSVCGYQAIDLQAESQQFEIKAHSIVITTGWQPYDAHRIKDLGYGLFPNVVTNVEMERFAAKNGPGKGKIERPSDKKEPKSVAFVQCAGSRDENHLPYCSGVCCSASLKQALGIKEKIHDCKVKIFYIDMRVEGRNEDFLARVEADPGIELIKGKVAKIEKNNENNNLTIIVEDIMSGRKMKEEFEMVVLATGIYASTVKEIGIVQEEYGFIDPDSLDDGIIVAGCARKPMDVAASLKDATGAALKAIQK